MRIRITQDTRGSENGLIVRDFPAGFVGDVEDSLALAFIGMGVAVAAKETPEQGATMETPEAPARRGRKPKAAGNA